MPEAVAQAEVIDFPLPVRGIHTASPWHAIPPGFTADAANVLTYDAGGRARIGQRPGLSKYFPFAFGGGADIQCLEQADVEVGGARTSYIIVVANGRTYRQIPGDGAAVEVDGGNQYFSAARRVECATFQNKTYFTDGLANGAPTGGARVLDHSTGTMSAWISEEHPTNPLPKDSGGHHCRLLTTYRGRMVHALPDQSDPHVVFFSMQNNPNNYDYGAIHSPVIAVATNVNFRAGQIGQPVTALIPFSNDLLLVGLDHAVYMFTGDPADGGTLSPVSDTVGILTPDSWCFGPSNDVYFVGTDGFYHLQAFGTVEKLSNGVFDSNFLGLPSTGYSINCAYDRALHGVWVTIVKTDAYASTTRNCFYDIGAQAFWPVTIPTAAQNPRRVLLFDGGDATNQDRVILFGGNDGFIRKLDHDNLADDGAAIPATLWLGPLQPMGALDEAILNGLQLEMGEGANFNAAVTLHVGASPRAAFVASAAKTTAVTTAGRQVRLGWRQSANAHLLKFANSTINKTMILERVSGIFERGGPCR